MQLQIWYADNLLSILLKRKLTSPKMCKFAIHLDCSGNLVNRKTPSYSFWRTFPNNVVKEMWCEMEIDNGGWIVSTNLYNIC